MRKLCEIVHRLATPEIRARIHFSSFAPGQILTEAMAPARSALLLLSGFASAVIALDGEAIDVGMTAGEIAIGFSGLPNHFASWVAREGGQLCMVSIDDLRTLRMEHPVISEAIDRGGLYLQVQAQQLAACNARHKAADRLPSFLLRAREASAADELTFRQDDLATALGLQRGSVSTLAGQLSEDGVISYARGRIRILDVGALEARACQCHRIIREQYWSIFDGAIQSSSGTTQG
jgi:CRP-like cAMP-binding protein